jgi:hypothetical protein
LFPAAGLVRFKLRPVRPLIQVLVAVGSFAFGALVAEAFGAANLGTAFAFGQIAFALGCVGLLLRA